MTLFYEALNRKVTILENGKESRITALEAVVLRVRNAALKGDMKALAFILAIEPQLERIAKPLRPILGNMTPKKLLTHMRR